MVLTGGVLSLVHWLSFSIHCDWSAGEIGYQYDDEPLARSLGGARLSEMDDDHYKEDTFFVGVETQVPLPALRRPTRKVEVLGWSVINRHHHHRHHVVKGRGGQKETAMDGMRKSALLPVCINYRTRVPVPVHLLQLFLVFRDRDYLLFVPVCPYPHNIQFLVTVCPYPGYEYGMNKVATWYIRYVSRGTSKSSFLLRSNTALITLASLTHNSTLITEQPLCTVHCAPL